MIGDKCSHGVKWGDECGECKLAAARWLVAQWGSEIDDARKVIAEAEAKTEEVPQ
jgi:hypothetical protein